MQAVVLFDLRCKTTLVRSDSNAEKLDQRAFQCIPSSLPHMIQRQKVFQR